MPLIKLSLCILFSNLTFSQFTRFTAGAVRDASLIPGLGRSPGEWNGNPLQYSGLENFMGRGARWVIVHRVTNSRPYRPTEHTPNTHICTHTCVYLCVCVCVYTHTDSFHLVQYFEGSINKVVQEMMYNMRHTPILVWKLIRGAVN